MTGERERLLALLAVVQRESALLLGTDSRLFHEPFTPERATRLTLDQDDAERVDAFVARFGRLQDTLADKLLPTLLRLLLEPVKSALDNLDKAEKLGLLESVDDWVAARELRNRLIHEYVRQADRLSEALNDAHERVPMLLDLASRLQAHAAQHGWVAGPA